ncbi:MAG: FISUMP domain-containing protein [Patescibacteria group bacterium]
MVALNTQRAKARDASRTQQLKALRNAIELYYLTNNQYPVWTSGGCVNYSGSPAPLSVLVPSFMNELPKDPKSSDYCYIYKSDTYGQNYRLAAYMENNTDLATKDGGTLDSYYELYSDSSYAQITNSAAITITSLRTCGTSISYAGQTYNTVQIGLQCWLKQHLNVGTKITSCTGGYVGACATGSDTVQNQGASCASIQKYCYSDDEANCTSDGGLYQWAQAMCGAASCNGTGESSPACTTPVQGICPTGWHLPSHYEIVVLERAVCTSGTCATDFPYDTSTGGWRGTTEGDKVKATGLCQNRTPCATSGYEGLLAGIRNTDGSFGARGADINLWSSSETESSNALRRSIYSSKATIYWDSNNKLYGWSVRCVND